MEEVTLSKEMAERENETERMRQIQAETETERQTHTERMNTLCCHQAKFHPRDFLFILCP